MTPEATRRRAIWQILLLAAGLFVLIAISTLSVILVNQSRKDNAWVVHTVEVENQLNTLLLQVRRAESASRGYLLTSEPRFLADYDAASAAIGPDVDKLSALSQDNPVQVENSKRLGKPVETRLAELTKVIEFARRNDLAGGIALLRQANASDAARRMNDVVSDMRNEEERLFARRTETADRTQQLASIVTVVGSALVIALAGISDLSGSPLGARTRCRRSAATRQQPQSRGHGRRAYRRPARSQQRNSALCLYRQP